MDKVKKMLVDYIKANNYYFASGDFEITSYKWIGESYEVKFCHDEYYKDSINIEMIDLLAFVYNKGA